MRGFSIIAGFLFVSTASAGIDVGGDFPREKESVILTLTTAGGAPASGAAVSATYGPGSEVLRVVPVGTTDDQGKLSWTPEEAGLVTLSAEIPGAEGEPESLTNTVSVRFAKPPGLGILVMLVAGFILYGGVVRGFLAIRKPVPSFPPDT